MKKLAIVIVCLLLVGAVAAWYFMRDGDKAREVLPADATVVAMFEPADFLRELGFDPAKADKLVLNFEDAVKGIDLSKPVYAFASENGLSGITLNVRDVDKLLKAFTLFSFASEEQRGYQWVANRNCIGCIDNDKMLLCTPVPETEQDALRGEMVKLMTQSRQDVPLLEEAKQQKGVFRLCSSLGNLPKEYAKSLPDGIDMKNAFLNSAFRIDKKAISLSARIEGAENLSLPLAPIKGSLIGVGIEKPFVWLCVNMKGEELLSHLRKIPELRSALLALNMCIDADMMIKAIDGDVTFAVPKADFEHPDFLFTATLRDTDFLKNADDWNQVTRRGASDFLIDYEGAKVFFGIRDERLYISSSQMLANAAFQETRGDAFQEAAKGKYLSASLGVGQILEVYPSVSIMLRAVPQLREITDAVQRVSLTSDSPQSIELSLETDKPVKELISNLWALMTGK